MRSSRLNSAHIFRPVKSRLNNILKTDVSCWWMFLWFRFNVLMEIMLKQNQLCPVQGSSSSSRLQCVSFTLSVWYKHLLLSSPPGRQVGKRKERVIHCVIKLYLTGRLNSESLEVSGWDQQEETNKKKTAVNRNETQQGGENETRLS